MTRREGLFALLLLPCLASIVIGVASISAAAGWIVGGILGGIWVWATMAEAAGAGEATE